MRAAVLLPVFVVALLVAIGTVFWMSYRGATGRDYTDATGEEIYRELCVSCHGEDGSAPMGLANSVKGKRRYWDVESLLEYVDDPVRYKRRDPRLSQSSRYMPAISRRVPEDARRRLAEYVLTLME